jgi:shikimate kinase
VVVATGGGTPCFYDNMEQIKRNGLSLYLKMAPKVLYDRLVHAKKVRPLVAEKSDEELLDYIKHKLSEREIFYKKSDYIISGLSLDIDLILDLIRRYPL